MAELHHDVAFAVQPFSAEFAREALAGAEVSTVLGGLPGRREGGVDDVVDVLLRLQQLALDLGDEATSSTSSP